MSKVQSTKSKKDKLPKEPVTLSVSMSTPYFTQYIISLIQLFSGDYVTTKEGLYHYLVKYTRKLIKDCNISEGEIIDSNTLFTKDIIDIKRILKNINLLYTNLKIGYNDGFVSLKESINEDNKSEDAPHAASTYKILLMYTSELATKLNEMITSLNITQHIDKDSKIYSIQNFIISQIKENNTNLTTELGALKKNKLFTNIDTVKYISNIPTDNISNFINYRINDCHLFTMFRNMEANTFENFYDTTWKEYIPSETTTKYMKYKTKYLRIKNKLMLILDK